MGLTRVLKTASATLTRTFYIDEAPQDCVSPPTVTVKRLDGTTVVTGTASSSGVGTGTYTYVLPGGPTAGSSATYQLDDLDVLWQGTVGGAQVTLYDRVEVVGGFLFSLAEARASDSSLSNTTTYTTDALRRARLDTETELERICKVSPVPRFRRVTLDGSGSGSILLPNPLVRNPIRFASQAYWYGQPQVTLTTLELTFVNADLASILRRADGNIWAFGTQNVIIEYEHGMTYPPPYLVDAALIRFRGLLNRHRTGVPDRAERIVNAEGGTYLLSMPDDEKTGIPEVDAAYRKFRHHQLPGIA
jgi:hypothetical protein